MDLRIDTVKEKVTNQGKIDLEKSSKIKKGNYIKYTTHSVKPYSEKQ